MGFLLVIKAEIVYRLIIMRRYWFATITGIVVSYGMLMALIYGFLTNREEVTEAIESSLINVDPERAVSVALGFVIGMYAFGIVGIFSQGLQGLARTGQLEQLCLSPHGLVTNFLARTSVGSVTSVLTSGIILTLVARTVDGQLHADVIPTITVLILVYLNLIGFGFMVGGLVLVFKQTGQIAILIRMALLGLALWAPDHAEQSDSGMSIFDWLLHVLPIYDAAICLKYVLITGQMTITRDAAGEVLSERFVSVFATPSLYFLVVSCAVWTGLGITVFRFMENWSRDKGTLGAY